MRERLGRVQVRTALAAVGEGGKVDPTVLDLPTTLPKALTH